MQIALELIHEFPPFLGEVNLGLFRLAALNGGVDAGEYSRQNDRENRTHQHQLEQREARLQGNREVCGSLHVRQKAPSIMALTGGGLEQSTEQRRCAAASWREQTVRPLRCR